MRRPLPVHILVALAISFGLSVVFWLGFGVFAPVGFILWSLVCAAVGVGAGYFATRNNIAITATVTFLLRLLIYAIAAP